MPADGYIADPDGQIGSLFDWMSAGDVEWKSNAIECNRMQTVRIRRARDAQHAPFFGAMEPGDNVALGNPSRVARGNRVTHLLYEVEH